MRWVFFLIVTSATGLGMPPTELSRRLLLTTAIVANPFEEINVVPEAPTIPGNEKTIDAGAAIDLVRSKKIKSCRFLTPNGSQGLCTLNDGMEVRVVIEETPDSSFGPLSFVSKLRDFKVPFTFPFNLEGYQRTTPMPGLRPDTLASAE